MEGIAVLTDFLDWAIGTSPVYFTVNVDRGGYYDVDFSLPDRSSSIKFHVGDSIRMCTGPDSVVVVETDDDKSMIEFWMQLLKWGE